MNIASMLNLSAGQTSREQASKEVTPILARRGSFTAPSSLPTPSPECMPAKQASGIPDNRVRTPWDAGGYSLPRDAAPQFQRTAFAFRPAGEPVEAMPVRSTPGGHSRHTSMASVDSSTVMGAPSVPTPFSTPRPARRMHSTSDLQQEPWMRRSSYCDTRPPPDSRRPSVLWNEHSAGVPSGTASSPRHRVSDSRGSFSSFCSSTFSGGHSRFSSLSTVSSHHRVSSVASEMPMLESKLEQLPKLTPTPEYVERREPSPRLPPLPQHGAIPTFVTTNPQGNPQDPILEARAMKRRRSRLSVDQSSHSALRSSVLHPLERIHKRTISAPNPPHIPSSTFAHSPSYLPPITPESFESVLPQPQLAMPRGRRSASRGRRTSRADVSPAAVHPVTRAAEIADENPANIAASPPPPPQVLPTPMGPSSDFHPRLLNICGRFGLSVETPLRGGDICMQVENCNTGSVPRKVISHIFGRNKVCTRRIPERAWVCMCRKHYQRIRYRKGPEFSMTQIDLVYEQIARMIFWSQGLETSGGVNAEGIFIRSWTFSIRKRELRRLVEMNGQDPLARWIIQSLGDGKTHDDILNIVERLHHDIQQGILRDVPPVEFLPEVVDAYTLRATHSPNVATRESSDDIEMQDISRAGQSENLGEDEGSPFSKDTSPLEPVEEERVDCKSPREGPHSPSSSVVSDDTERLPNSLAHHQRQRSDSQVYAPQSHLAFTQSDDRRSSYSEHDSQNPALPSKNDFNIDNQIQESAMPITEGPQGPVSEPHRFRGPYPNAHQSVSSESVVMGRHASGSSRFPTPMHSVFSAPLTCGHGTGGAQLEPSFGQYQPGDGLGNVFSPVQPFSNRTQYHDPLAPPIPHSLASTYVLGPTRRNRAQATVSQAMDGRESSWQGIKANTGSNHTPVVTEAGPTNFPKGLVTVPTASSTGAGLRSRGHSGPDPNSPAGPAGLETLSGQPRGPC
ncbi:hypothetical protein EDB81DRAFT_759130 [Dactylonectria macrodidyma]|uniref:Uncharacterized protein n=1 Tax=Dactylonectria macrodidyma TaxID=307937 RepID=A0A9P9F044_9HYPO|nr:hypothetical protein EDB81DRAFT_759130 [Dactylonectria macrodidyma]